MSTPPCHFVLVSVLSSHVHLGFSQAMGRCREYREFLHLTLLRRYCRQLHSELFGWFTLSVTLVVSTFPAPHGNEIVAEDGRHFLSWRSSQILPSAAYEHSFRCVGVMHSSI